MDTNRFRYCGEYYDIESGTIYLRARYYSAGAGRFTQEDPIKDGYNWYNYCAGNPVNLVDPSGMKYINEIDFTSEDGSAGNHESGKRKKGKEESNESNESNEIDTSTSEYNEFEKELLEEGCETISEDMMKEYLLDQLGDNDLVNELIKIVGIISVAYQIVKFITAIVGNINAMNMANLITAYNVISYAKNKEYEIQYLPYLDSEERKESYKNHIETAALLLELNEKYKETYERDCITSYDLMVVMNSKDLYLHNEYTLSAIKYLIKPIVIQGVSMIYASIPKVH